MADSESSNDAMEVDLRAADLSLRPQIPQQNNHRYPIGGGITSRCSNPEESIDLSVRPRSCSSSESAGGGSHYQRSRVRQRWPRESSDQGDQRSRDRPTSGDRSSKVHLNGHINGFSDSSQLDSTDSDMAEMPPMRLLRELTPVERKHHEALMHRLKEELRNEEMKLVLLKKLRQSQSLKESLMATQSGAVSGASPAVMGSTPAVAAVTGMQIGSGKLGLAGRLPGQQTCFTNLSRNSSKLMGSATQSLLIPPMSHGNAQALLSAAGSRGSSSASSVSTLSANLMLQQSMLRPGMLSSRMPVTTPPNVVIGYHNLQGSNSANKPGTASTQNQVSVPQVTPNTSSPTPQPSGQISQAERAEAHQTPAQRQAAAKLALRKQLEKTLLQIPPPKPPPPEMHFIPNANNQEFVYLLGLEVVVGFLVGDDQRKKPPPDPFDCVQCCTDFTPVWKWQETSSSSKRRHQHLPAVICESCVTTNIKKALKAEHTNRLKTAFVKALQQEQEIEQRMSQGSGSPPPLCTTPPVTTSAGTCTVPAVQRASTPPTSHSPIPSSLSRSERGPAAAAAANAVAAAVANSAALLQQMPKLSAAHQSLLQAQQLQQLAQSLPQHQPQPAHMLPFGPLLAAQAYSYGMMGKSSLSTSDLQRQYLLDMIPPRSMSQSSMNWKT